MTTKIVGEYVETGRTRLLDLDALYAEEAWRLKARALQARRWRQLYQLAGIL
ncbi:MAG TPA: hypothetical protein VLF40_05930 [Candidatus Saccharimonadales bacterium]|nr:hypothetical protein [Candidatus Saccharimonadales bacterium]